MVGFASLDHDSGTLQAVACCTGYPWALYLAPSPTLMGPSESTMVVLEQVE